MGKRKAKATNGQTQTKATTANATDSAAWASRKVSPEDEQIAKLTPAQLKYATNKRYADFVENTLYSRASFFKEMMDPRRNINDECGFPETENIRPEEYRRLYDREAIAARVVEIMPSECWLVQPEVFEEEVTDSDDKTEFETAWDDLAKSLRGTSWYQDNKGSPVWEILQRADKLSGIGSYGVILLGFNDGMPLNEPLEPSDGLELTFVRAFDESQAKITLTDADRTSRRFGHPIKYGITLNDPQYSGIRSQQSDDAVGTTADVHWTRVIHVADNLGSNEINGVPRMQQVYNNILSLQKVVHGSGEMFWKGAFPGLSIESNPQMGPNVKINPTQMKDMVEDYQNSLQRYIAVIGMQVKSLAPQVSDPTAHIEVQIQAICIKIGTPKRVFSGSEVGELASSQDTKRWNGRLAGRRENYLTPRVIVPFIDRLIEFKVLPEPQGYSVVWPDQESLTELEQATISKARAEAAAVYVGGSVEAIIEPLDFWTRIMGMPTEEAEEVIERVMKNLSSDDLSTRMVPEPPPVVVAPGSPKALGAAGAGAPKSAKKPAAKKQPVPKKPAKKKIPKKPAKKK